MIYFKGRKRCKIGSNFVQKSVKALPWPEYVIQYICSRAFEESEERMEEVSLFKS